MHWLVPVDVSPRTGGSLWNARMAAALGAEVRFVPVRGPSDAEMVPDGALVVADGLVWPRLAALAGRSRVAVVVHQLQVHEGGDDRAERASWAGVQAIVATSEATRREIGLPDVHVVIPGTSPAPPARGGGGLVALGSLVPRKGHDVLLRALARVPWRLRCAGGAPDPTWSAQLRSLAADLGVTDRVEWLGELDDAGVAAALDRADLLVHAARYEAFGMVVAEAVARGLPVLTTPAGVVEHLPPGTVEVARPETFGDALAGLVAEPVRRAALADRARHASLPDWSLQAARLREVLAGL